MMESASQRLQIGRVGANDCKHDEDDTGGRACTKIVRELALDLYFRGWGTTRGLLLADFWIVEIVLQFKTKISSIGGETERGLELHQVGSNKFIEFAVKILHALGAAIAHRVQERLAFAFALFDVFPSAHCGLENFDRGNAPRAVFFGEQALRNDEAESLGKAGTQGLLVGERENTPGAVHSFCPVNHMRGREYTNPGFLRLISNLKVYAVTHFPDEN